MLSEIRQQIHLDYILRDPEEGAIEEADQDPLSHGSLVAQTERLCRLIERAKEHDDVVLLRSLRHELLLTRWALVKSNGGGRRKVHRAKARREPDSPDLDGKRLPLSCEQPAGPNGLEAKSGPFRTVVPQGSNTKPARLLVTGTPPMANWAVHR